MPIPDLIVTKIQKLPGIMGCERTGPQELSVRSIQVKEAGRSVETNVCGKSVYLKDAPGTIFESLGYSVSRGDDVNLALNWIAGLGWPEVHEKRRGIYVDNSPFANHLRHGMDLVRRYSFGESELLPEMLNNVLRVWDAYYQTYPPQIGNAQLIRDFLLGKPQLAKSIISWYVHRGYKHGAPHWFCWDRRTDDWFWASGGSEKYKPKIWMQDLIGSATPTLLVLRFHADGVLVEKPKSISVSALADALLTRDQRVIAATVDRFKEEFFGGTHQTDGRHPGVLLGYHYSSWAALVTKLRQIQRDDAAEVLLLALVNCVEKSIPFEKIAAPWYYEQLAIIYRKRKEFLSEISLLERQLRVRPFDTDLHFDIEKARLKLLKGD